MTSVGSQEPSLDDDANVWVPRNHGLYTSNAAAMEPNLFAVLFTLGRLPGWIGHWRELISDPQTTIARPRHGYIGHTERHYTPITQR